MQADAERHAESEYRQEHRKPSARLRAETYFLLGASRQLLRAMERYGAKKTVPAFKHGDRVLIAVRQFGLTLGRAGAPGVE